MSDNSDCNCEQALRLKAEVAAWKQDWLAMKEKYEATEQLHAEVGELKAALARWTEYDKLIADGHTVTQVSQLEADLLRENGQLRVEVERLRGAIGHHETMRAAWESEVEQLKSTLREVGTALTGVECGPGQDFTGNPYVDGVVALRAEVERLRVELEEDQGVVRVWRGRTGRAEASNEQLRALLGECMEWMHRNGNWAGENELLSRIRAALGGGQ